MVLFINCCPREESRTRRLADAVLKKYGTYEEIDLYSMDLKPVDKNRLDLRTELLNENRLDADEFSLSRQFADADTIIIAAPFWDLSFPSKLKLYIENIYITGIVSCYGPDGMPVGLCKAKELIYVTTAGGPFDGRFGYGYLEALCKVYFGIPEVSLVKAEMLDIIGNDPDRIVEEAIEEYCSCESER